VIGVGGGVGEPHRFRGVTDAHLLADGGVVVGACRAGELRFFDAGGTHLRTTVAVDEAARERAWLTRIFPVRGDSVAVYDQLAGRVSVFSGEGDLGRSFAAGGAMRGYLVKGALGDGRFVGVATDRSGEPEEGALHRTPQTLVILDEVGRVVDSLGPFPGPERMALPRGDRAVRFGRTGHVAVSEAGVAYSVADAHGPLQLDPSLDHATRVTPITVPGPVTTADVERWADSYETREMAPEGGVIPAYSPAYADSLPVHGDMYLDRDGGLWLQDPVVPWDYPLTYTRYVDGSPKMRVELPPRFFPFELHPDRVLGVAYGADGGERVELLTLVRGDTSTVARTAREVAPPAVPRCGSWASR